MPVPEVIGEGAYGCVHKPSLLCKNKKLSYKNKISKVMLTKEAMKELKEYAIISRVDKKNEYYVGMPTTCHVKNTTQAIRAVEKCKHIKKKYFRRTTVKKGLSKMSLLVMSDGGKDFKGMATYFEKLSDTPDTIKKIKMFWVEVHRLFRGLLVFQKYGIIHHDIKPQNLVYNTIDNRVNFIDFGHMRNIKNELEKCDRSDNWIYDYPFWNYPFEIQFLNRGEYIHFVNKSEKEKERFIIDFIEDLKKDRDTKFTTAFRIFMDYFLRNRSKADEKIMCDRYIMDFKNTVLNQMKEYDTFASKSIESIDVYGLGMSLQFMLAYTKRFMESVIVKELDECFFRMTTANLAERYTIKEATDAFESALEIAAYASFENNKPVQERNSKSVEKSLQKIKTSDISIHKLTQKQVQRAIERF
jgi:serine/threonine protein kinase